MNTNIKTTGKIDTKVLLSTLWIVVMINMLKADILSLFIPGVTDELANFSASAGASIPQLLLIGAVMGNLAIAMIILSRVLKYGLNRWVNIIVGVVTITYIWGGAASYPHYIFIASVETLCLLLIVWFAWKWTNPEG
jgi:phosphoglycerol transferase MdoB-like AlkP superfamily enzyme